MTDIHAHVLAGLDDGPADLAESDLLLRALRQVGVDTVVCTPHYLHPSFDVTQHDIDESFAALCALRPEGGVWPQLQKGAEVRITKSLVSDIRARTVPTLGDTPFVLVEFPGASAGREETELVHELVVRGYRPILAHPERNTVIQKRPELLRDLIEAGIVMQVTADCYRQAGGRAVGEDEGGRGSDGRAAGDGGRGNDRRTVGSGGRHAAGGARGDANARVRAYGSRAIEVARWMIEEDLVDYVASDTHNVTTRPPCDARWLRGITFTST